MGELLQFAARIARREYHPSHCVEDYRKGTGRVQFAEMCCEYGDRLAREVELLKRADARIAALEKVRELVAEAAELVPCAIDSPSGQTQARAWKWLARWREVTGG